METGEILFIWATDGRSSFQAYVFLKEVLSYYENKPEVVVDRGFWYLWALQRLGLKYRHETFGKRNSIESPFSQLKDRTKVFITDSPTEVLLVLFSSELKSFIAFYNCWGHDLDTLFS